MLCAELRAIGRPLILADRPTPEPKRGEVRVRVEACGICGSDLFLQAGGFGNTPLPIVPGHEAAGVVDALGEGVHGWEVGDQVAMYYIDAPADSRFARLGRANIGPDVRRMGVDVDGALAQYVVRPAETLIAPPERLEPAVLAVLTDAVATPYHALVAIGQVQPGERVLVLGVGGIGSNAVQLGKLLGATVIAATRNQTSLDLARALGADSVVQLGSSDDATRIREASGGDGPDVVIQCGASAALDELALEVAGFLGRVVLVGTCADAFRVTSSSIIWREVSVLGSRGFTAGDIKSVIDLYLRGDIRVDHLLQRLRPLDEVNDALDDLRAHRVLRTVILP